MHSLPALVIFICSASAAATVSLHRYSGIPLEGLLKRQDICVPVPAPATCERSCGAGNIQCISYPNCYNPSAGESCCSNGKYCPADYYCTDAGCCPNGTPLEECGATTTLSVIAPPGPEPTAPTDPSSAPVETYSSESATTEYATSSIESASEITYTDAATYTPTEVPYYPTTTEEAPYYPTTTEYPTTTSTLIVYPPPAYNATASSNLTASISPPAQVTVNAARALDGGVSFWGVGGLGFLLAFL